MGDKLIGVDPNYDPEKVTEAFIVSVKDAIQNNQLETIEGFNVVDVVKFDAELDVPIYSQGSSRNDVRMIILIDDNGERHPVFIKPLVEDEFNNELTGHEVCNELGLRHFEPIAVIRNGNGSFILTKKKNVKPLSVMAMISIMEFEKRARECVRLLKKLHSKGLLHRDAKPKNFAYDDHDNLYVFDFQDSSYIPDQKLTKLQIHEELLTFLLEFTLSTKNNAPWAKSEAVKNLLEVMKDEIIRDYFAGRI